MQCFLHLEDYLKNTNLAQYTIKIFQTIKINTDKSITLEIVVIIPLRQCSNYNIGNRPDSPRRLVKSVNYGKTSMVNYYLTF